MDITSTVLEISIPTANKYTILNIFPETIFIQRRSSTAWDIHTETSILLWRLDPDLILRLSLDLYSYFFGRRIWVLNHNEQNTAESIRYRVTRHHIYTSTTLEKVIRRYETVLNISVLADDSPRSRRQDANSCSDYFNSMRVWIKTSQVVSSATRLKMRLRRELVDRTPELLWIIAQRLVADTIVVCYVWYSVTLTVVTGGSSIPQSRQYIRLFLLIGLASQHWVTFR